MLGLGSAEKERGNADRDREVLQLAKGFGFIVVDGGGPDVFIHVSALERSGLKSLTEGQKVSFDTKNG